MKPSRDYGYIIADIKSIRGLTRLLGKLSIKGCYGKRTMTRYSSHINFNIMQDFSYGFGLKDSKDLCERTWNYFHEEQRN